MRIHSPLPDSNLGSGGSHLLAYVKPWLSWSDQLLPLINRGLVVKDRAAAMEFLSMSTITASVVIALRLKERAMNSCRTQHLSKSEAHTTLIERCAIL